MSHKQCYEKRNALEDSLAALKAENEALKREVGGLSSDIKEAYEDRQEAVNDRDAALLKCKQWEAAEIDRSHSLAIAWDAEKEFFGRQA